MGSGTRIAVVDEQNRFLRWAERAEVHAARLVHRSVHIAVHDGAGRLLVQRRHRHKLTNAGHWDLSCAGHVEEADYGPAGPGVEGPALDAVYAAVARRELAEELGLVVAPAALELVGRFGPVPGIHYEWIHLFRTLAEGPFTLQQEEVEEARFVTRAELASLAPQTTSLAWFAGTVFEDSKLAT
jgi:isopentenyldiphosphate isomerase